MRITRSSSYECEKTRSLSKVWAQMFGVSPLCGPQSFGASPTCGAQDILKSIMKDDSRSENLCLTQWTCSETLWPTQQTSSEHLCPHFGLAPRFFAWAQHFRSSHGAGGGGGSILLILRLCHYDDLRLAPNAITYY